MSRALLLFSHHSACCARCHNASLCAHLGPSCEEACKLLQLSAACGVQALLGEQQTVALAQALAQSAACSDGPTRCAFDLNERLRLVTPASAVGRLAGACLSGHTRHSNLQIENLKVETLLMAGQLSSPS